MSQRNRLFVGVLSACACGIAFAADPNLMPNGDFSSANQVSGWTSQGNGPVIWSADDAAGIAGSGSMEFQAVNLGSGANAIATNCFAVTPGAAYSMGGQSKIVAGAQANFSAFCVISSTTNCSGGVITVLSPTLSTNTSWTPITPINDVLPAGAHSVGCDFGLFGSQAASGRLDNLFFNSAAPPVSVKLQSFEVK